MVGLSDEAGAGANVGLAIKVRHAPVLAQVARLDKYVQQTLCSTKPGLPYSASLQAGAFTVLWHWPSSDVGNFSDPACAAACRPESRRPILLLPLHQAQLPPGRGSTVVDVSMHGTVACKQGSEHFQLCRSQ